MDSCNGDSLQSSSGGGGDEDYESASTFLITSSSGDASLANLPNFQPPPSPLFESLSSYFDTFPRSPLMSDHNPLSVDPAWPKALRPPPASPDPAKRPDTRLMTFSSSGNTPMIISPKLGQGSFLSNTSTNQSWPVQLPASGGPARSSKKRSRASRRAPTTVLTADPANFRAMVQEFTGIPTPAFMSTSPFSRPPLDLLQAMPPYLSRPFAQRMQSPSMGYSSMIRANANTPSSNALPSPDLLNMQKNNPMSTIQSLFQSSLINSKYNASSTMPAFGAGLQGSSIISSSPAVADYGDHHPRAIPNGQIAPENMHSRGQPNDPTLFASGFGPRGGGPINGVQADGRRLPEVE